MRLGRRSWSAVFAAALMVISACALAQPIVGTHEPRTYDEGLIPRFSFELIERPFARLVRRRWADRDATPVTSAVSVPRAA